MKLFEVYQEEDGPTDGAFHDGNLYSVNKLVELTQDTPVQQISVADLMWHLPYDGMNNDRMSAADLSVPILVTMMQGKYVVLDGAHRLTKAATTGVDTIPAKLVTKEMLQQAKK